MRDVALGNYFLDCSPLIVLRITLLKVGAHFGECQPQGDQARGQVPNLFLDSGEVLDDLDEQLFGVCVHSGADYMPMASDA